MKKVGFTPYHDLEQGATMSENTFFILYSFFTFQVGWWGCWYTQKYILPRLRRS